MGFVAIYRWKVEPGHEAGFRDQWRAITSQALELGGLGSCLTRSSDGEYVAIALWPSERARAEAFEKIQSAPAPGVRRLSEWQLQVEDDLWVNSPFGRK